MRAVETLRASEHSFNSNEERIFERLQIPNAQRQQSHSVSAPRLRVFR